MRHSPKGTIDDVRMRGFLRRQTVEAALSWLDTQLHVLDAEPVPLREAAGRVLATSVVSDFDVPGFDRATMDGYALVATSTEGASTYNVLPIVVIGDSMPGRPFEGSVLEGQAVRVMTGAPMPPGTDAVLPAEWTAAEPTTAPGATPGCIGALMAMSPGKLAICSGVKISATCPMDLEQRISRWSLVAMPALSWPRCCSA